MKLMIRGAVLAVVMVMSVSTMALAVQVFFKDGNILAARSYSRSNGVVTVQVNRDIVLHFSEDEVDLKRTSRSAVHKKRRHVAKAAPKAAEGEKAAAAKPAVPPAAGKPAPTPPAKPGAPVPPAAAAKPAAPKAAGKPAATPPPKPGAPTPPAAAAKQAAPAAPTAAKPATPAPATAAKPGTPPAAQSAVAQKPATPPAPPQGAPKPQLPKPQPPPPPSAAAALLGGSFFMGFLIAMLVLLVVVIASAWKLYEKAGEAGWKSIVPFYNVWVLVQICGKPSWWFFIILFVPGVNIIFNLLLCLALAERFGKSTLYGVGIFFLPIIFWPMLAFGNATYSAP